MTAISYSVGGEQLHQALHGYKRLDGSIAMAHRLELALILARFLELHERCLAAALDLQADQFPLVTVVPSSDPDRDQRHPLRTLVGRSIPATAGRHERLLVRTSSESAPRTIDPEKFVATRPLESEPVLLIDDTWTTGASARSAAAALRRAGAGPVACLVIGRHINRDHADIDARLPRSSSNKAFDWGICSLCARPSR